jgi:MFS family permease
MGELRFTHGGGRPDIQPSTVCRRGCAAPMTSPDPVAKNAAETRQKQPKRVLSGYPITGNPLGANAFPSRVGTFDNSSRWDKRELTEPPKGGIEHITDVVARRLPRDLYVAAGARSGSILGNVVAVTALQLEFHDRGAGAWMVAGLLAAGMLPIVLLAPLVGPLVDRFDSRMLIVVSSLWQAVACALLAFVSQPQMVLLLATLNACGTAVTIPLFQALTSVMVSGKQLAAANSVQQGAVVMAMMIGPAVGGLLTGITGGARVPLVLDAVVFVVIAGTGVLIRTRRRPGSDELSSTERNGMSLLFTDRILMSAGALAVLLALVVHVIYVAQVFLVRDTFGASELAFGLLQATQTVGLLIGTVLASWLNTVRRIVFGIPLAATMMSLALIMVGVVRLLPATFALYAVAGVCMSMVSVPMGTLLLLRIPESAIGRVMAGYTAIHRTATLIAYGAAGLVVGLLPPAMVYVLSGTAALLVVLVLVPVFRRAWVYLPRNEELSTERVG